MLRFLLVEDDLFVAAHIDDLLIEEGLHVIGPVGTLDKAKLLARDETLDAAVLDVNIVGGRIDDVAEILTHRDIPFLFVTSCEHDDLPMKHREATVVHKPFNDADLMRAVRRIKPHASNLGEPEYKGAFRKTDKKDMANLEANYRAAEAASVQMNDNVNAAAAAVSNAVEDFQALTRPGAHRPVAADHKYAAKKHAAAVAAYKAAQDAFAAQQRQTKAAFDEARAGTGAPDQSPRLKAGCERRIELAVRADELRHELGEIEIEAEAAQLEIHNAVVSGAHLPVGNIIGAGRLASAAEERNRWSGILTI